MIYQFYFSGLAERIPNANYKFGDKVTHVNHANDWADFRKVLEETPHYFVFIITKVQWENWEKFRDKYKLKEFEHFEMPYFVSNHRYQGAGRKLRLVILKGKGE